MLDCPTDQFNYTLEDKWLIRTSAKKKVSHILEKLLRYKCFFSIKYRIDNSSKQISKNIFKTF